MGQNMTKIDKALNFLICYLLYFRKLMVHIEKILYIFEFAQFEVI
jgi:hypothetical protein